MKKITLKPYEQAIEIRKKIKSKVNDLQGRNIAEIFYEVEQNLRDLKNDYKVATQAINSYGSVVLNRSKTTAFVFNVAPWKRDIVRAFLNQYNVFFIPLTKTLEEHSLILSLAKNAVFIVWGRSVPWHIRSFADKNEIAIYHLEDGFIRSMGLGSDHVLPLSLCLDKTGLYYDATQPSDLETLLATYDFSKDTELLRRAKAAIEFIKTNKLSKYNTIRTDLAQTLYGPKTKPRILVLGQVEDDQSLIYGCDSIMSNLQLIEQAINDYPNAQIIYKPHPDVMSGNRHELSKISKVEDKVEILAVPLSLQDALKDVDRVYTMTSLGGFEALIHEVPVTTFGAPFYSNWGLTEDKQVVSRRQRTLTLEEVFAASYILYPRYIDLETHTDTTLENTLQYIVDAMGFVYGDGLDYIKSYNFGTQHPLPLRYFAKTKKSKTAIISNQLDAADMAQRFAAFNKPVSVFFTRDEMANNQASVIIDKYKDLVKVSSLHKAYSTPMSEVELLTVNRIQILRNELYELLVNISNGLVDKGILYELASGIEDYIYYDMLRFNAYDDLLEQYDQILIYVDEYANNADVVDSLYYHAKQKNLLGKLTFASLKNDELKDIVTRDLTKNSFKTNFDTIESRKTFAKFWWGVEQENPTFYQNLPKVNIVCSSLINENYGYSPAGFKLLEVLSRASSREILYVNSALISDVVQDGIKASLLTKGYAKNTQVYEGNLLEYRKRYSESVIQYHEFFKTDLLNNYNYILRQQLPSEIIEVLSERIDKYITSLFPHFIFISEMYKIIPKTGVFFTGMERSTLSRITTMIAQSMNVPTVGIQPQVISESPRYRGSIVDKMGVIDSQQVQIYQALGTDPKSIYNVGSVNIIERLQYLDEVQHDFQEGTLDVMFAMQHSIADDMYKIANALKQVVSGTNIRLHVKPHPHQELPVLNGIKEIFEGIPNIKVYTKETNTYELLAQCKIIVGLFSSVLLESGIYGKKVIVADFNDLHPSIDFSLLGLAKKVNTTEQLAAVLHDFLNEGEAAQSFAASRMQYLNKNPQFTIPYNFRYLEDFIVESLPKDAL